VPGGARMLAMQGSGSDAASPRSRETSIEVSPCFPWMGRMTVHASGDTASMRGGEEESIDAGPRSA
jgi:hypothetical protein